MQSDDKSASELTEQIVEKEDELAALLSDEAKEILDQMRDKQLDLSTSNERKAFISGFRLRARIVLEVMDETDAPSDDLGGTTIKKLSFDHIPTQRGCHFVLDTAYRIYIRKK